ncbi:uncharacterized protein [Nicotiana sylvestris]|uniref:uncharacterized protein n=1 Tax=Nicotiana sylvestris TaxID=4096 RepID=UPI00388C9C73
MRLEMNEMQLAMAKVQKGPKPLVTPTPPPGHTPEYPSPAPSTSFPSHHYYQGRDAYDPQAPPPNQNPPPPNVPVFVAPPPATLQRSSSEPLFQVHDTQYFPPEPTFKAPEPYTYTPQFGIPEEAEKPVKNTEHEEVIRKVKSLEQSFRNMHGLGHQFIVTSVSVVYLILKAKEKEDQQKLMIEFMAGRSRSDGGRSWLDVRKIDDGAAVASMTTWGEAERVLWRVVAVVELGTKKKEQKRSSTAAR